MTTSKYLDLLGALNQLAGTTATPVDANLAANIWAGWNYQKNGALDLLGALNYKIGVPFGTYDMNGAGNKLAGLPPGTLDLVGALNYILGNST